MKTTAKILLAASLAASLSIGAVLPSTAFADVSEACDKYPNGSVKSSCEKGYEGIQCNTLSGPDATGCENGKNQAVADGVLPSNNGGTNNGSTQGKSECGGAKTEIISCDDKAGLGAISSIIRMVIMIVTILIGVVATGGITYAAILYAGARDNKGQVEEAITIIRNVAIGLVLYGFTIALINWLVPGGVIG
jgi:hypothetical protein